MHKKFYMELPDDIWVQTDVQLYGHFIKTERKTEISLKA